MVKENNLTITHPELCKEWNYEKNEKGPENYTYGSHAKVFWKLNYYDTTKNKNFVFEWQSRIDHRCNGAGCPFISGQAIFVGFNDLATLRKDLVKEWDFEKNEKGPENYTYCSHTKVFWKKEYTDPKTGKNFVFRWSDIIADRTKKNTGCPYLAPNPKVWKGFNDLATTHSSIAKEWNYEKNYPLTPQQVSIGSEKIAYFTCEKGHTFKSRIYSRINNGCPFCSASSAEKLMHSVLDRNNIEFEIEKRFIEEVKRNPYDIFLNNENLFIELDGEQHFKSMKFFDICTPFSKRVEIDNRKNKCAFENNIPLLRIPYTYFEDELQMEALVMDFIRTRIIPKEIIDFYKDYEFSNYAELAENYNATLRQKAS